MKTSVATMKLFSRVLLVSMFLSSLSAHAYTLPSPATALHELLSESVPTAFSPNEFTAEDFELRWEGAPIPGVELELGRESLQWVRVNEVLVLPRARLLVRLHGLDGGRVQHASFSTPLRAEGGSVPIALISGARNPVDFVVSAGGKETSGRVLVFFAPKKKAEGPRVFVDPSCSRFAVQGVAPAGWHQDQQWIYVGCRQLVSEGADHRTPILELYVFWDGAGDTLQIGKVATPASGTSIWPLRIAADPGTLDLQSGQDSLRLSYSTAEYLKLGSLGLGLGPYSYRFEGLQGDRVSGARPILTLYGSYFVTETSRIVAFNATAVSDFGYTDLGIYFNSENFRFIDRRLSINFLLGAHLIGFKTGADAFLLFGAPQGVELIYTDAFRRGNNLSMGGFIYPSISGKSYYNVWLRWGSRIFAEFNYIAWEENLREERVSSRSLGITLGIPLARFL